MKKMTKKTIALFALFGGLIFTGCSSDNNDPTEKPVVENNILNGELTENRTLNPEVEYELTGSFEVLSGVTLTIPAGTKIVASEGTDVYIAIHQDADIKVMGTSNKPVVMTSVNGAPGDWGGLVILGKGVTTEGVNATAEVGGFIYGGTDNTDSSGSIEYLVIDGAGAQINSESQYNGLTLYAVGSGTNIQNIAILNGADDGVEFFGGAVSVKDFYLENNEDDAVDWTEGWSGTITNTYVLHTIAGFSTAVEADGVNNNPRLINFTAVSTVGGTALQFKKESGATFEGLSLTGYDTPVEMKDNGALANVVIEGESVDLELNYTTPPSTNQDKFGWINNRSNVDANILQGTVTGTITLDPAVTYNLNSSYIVQDGGKLVIPAGTKIMARKGGTDVYIAVLQGGKIEIQGTRENPVVMSSEDALPGDWGGLTIAGKATTTEGVNATAEIGGFIYGGTNDADNSGSIKNLVIAGTGAQINSESQYNGVSLYAVGSGTTIENVAVINGADDGIEFFGGTVSAKNLYFENNEDDAVDWTEGWSGTVTNVYVKHTIAGFSTAVEADGVNNSPKLINFTAVSTTGGTALQFKKQSGATLTNVYLEGYDTNIDMKDGGALTNVKIDGAAAVPNAVYNLGTKVDLSSWTWIKVSL